MILNKDLIREPKVPNMLSWQTDNLKFTDPSFLDRFLSTKHSRKHSHTFTQFFPLLDETACRSRTSDQLTKATLLTNSKLKLISASETNILTQNTDAVRHWDACVRETGFERVLKWDGGTQSEYLSRLMHEWRPCLGLWKRLIMTQTIREYCEMKDTWNVKMFMFLHNRCWCVNTKKKKKKEAEVVGLKIVCSTAKLLYIHGFKATT